MMILNDADENTSSCGHPEQTIPEQNERPSMSRAPSSSYSTGRAGSSAGSTSTGSASIVEATFLTEVVSRYVRTCWSSFLSCHWPASLLPLF